MRRATQGLREATRQASRPVSDLVESVRHFVVLLVCLVGHERDRHGLEVLDELHLVRLELLEVERVAGAHALPDQQLDRRDQQTIRNVPVGDERILQVGDGARRQAALAQVVQALKGRAGEPDDVGPQGLRDGEVLGAGLASGGSRLLDDEIAAGGIVGAGSRTHRVRRQRRFGLTDGKSTTRT